MATDGPIDKRSAAEIRRLSIETADNPKSKVFLKLAEEYVKVGMLPEAIAVLEDGLKVHPKFATALIALGKVYIQSKQPAKARGTLEDVVRTSPDNLLAHRLLATLYAQAENWEAAGHSCEKVLLENPMDKDMRTLKAKIDKQAAAPSAASASPSMSTESHDANTPNEDGKVEKLKDMLDKVQQRRTS